jgi:carbon starvation protein
VKSAASILIWILVVLLGAGAYLTLALHRGEHINSAYILVAALCTYAIGYRFYSKWIATRVLLLDDRRATPCEVHDDGKDFVRTNKWIVFGHHFAAISGPGPLVGPVLAAQFGFLPGTLWILIGVTLGGAVQDFVILFASLRRDGKSLGQMVRDELNSSAGVFALLAILCILVILLAVLALVVVKALAESPWGVFTVGTTIPIAIGMGLYLRFWRVGKVMEASAWGVISLLLAVWGGKLVHETPALARAFGCTEMQLAWSIIIYGLAASILPVWLLLAPRDYLSTFMKLGTILALALGIFLVLPDLKMPALSRFVDGSGPVVAGKVFPFCFITIACGAISGFHTLIASGTTPKILTRESYSRPVGYGAMCLESLVAIMALIAACTLDPGVYLGMNIKGEAAQTAAKVTALGFPLTLEQMDGLARELGEKTLFGRTGGAATLAVGMAQIFSKTFQGRWLDLWYHFAIMFEALFILTTIDAGTRVGRYLLQDALGHLWAPLGDTRRLSANLVASLLMVGAWGYFLIQGVRDPLGGINSLWPLFGIANQMLAAIALCLGTTILIKMALRNRAERLVTGQTPHGPCPSPAIALITFIPLVWLLSATITAGVQKIWHPDPRIGFLAQAEAQQKIIAERTGPVSAGQGQSVSVREPSLIAARRIYANQILDAVVAGGFLILVGIILVLSAREWIALLRGSRKPVLRETAPQWLPEYALKERPALGSMGFIGLMVALARNLSHEDQVDRATPVALQQTIPETVSEARLDPSEREASRRKDAYLAVTERRFRGFHRCC